MSTKLAGIGVAVSSFLAFCAVAQAPAFVLRVDAEGSFFWPDAVTAVDEASVVAKAAAALSRDADVALVVEADTAAPYQRVTRAAVLLQEAGAKKVSFRTRNGAQQ